jgi:hypothetical protein
MSNPTGDTKGILPTDQDAPVAQDILGIEGKTIRRHGLLRLLAQQKTLAGSAQLAKEVGMEEDFNLLAMFRNVLYTAKRAGLVEERKVSYNFHLYKISDKGRTELESVNDILDEFGWGWRAEQPQPHTTEERYNDVIENMGL